VIPASVMRERWTRLGAILVGLAIVIVAVLGVVGAQTLVNSRAGRRASSLPPAQTITDTPAALLAVRSDTGALSALVVLVKAPAASDGTSRGGAIIPLPVGSGVQIGRNKALNRLAELYLAGGVTELAEQTSGLLAVGFSVVAEVDIQGMAAMLQPVGTVSVTQAAGTKFFAAPAAALLLSEQDGRVESPHFESTIAYWNGLAAHVGKGMKFEGSQTSGEMTRFLNSILSGPIKVYPLRGEKVAQGEANPNGVDVYQLDMAAVNRAIGLAAPSESSPIDGQFYARVVNPTGEEQLTLAAIRLIRGAQGVVTVVEENGIKMPKKTEFSLSGRLEKSDVKELAAAFGPHSFVSVGKPGTTHTRYTDVDITVVIGPEFTGAGSK